MKIIRSQHYLYGIWKEPTLNFIEKNGANAVAYVVSSNDKAIKKDYFDEIWALATKSKIKVFNRSEDFLDLEKNLDIYINLP